MQRWGAPRKSDYEVGYRKPPKAGQFKKGESGNPRGRPKVRPTLERMVEELLAQTMVIAIDGKQQRVTRDKALLMSAFAKALKGDSRSIKFLTDIIARRPASEPPNNFVSIRLVKTEE